MTKLLKLFEIFCPTRPRFRAQESVRKPYKKLQTFGNRVKTSSPTTLEICKKLCLDLIYLLLLIVCLLPEKSLIFYRPIRKFTAIERNENSATFRFVENMSGFDTNLLMSIIVFYY